uniref:Uncharacterized protein n=2 Tax=viral metagenome TaxID=1070528 RepID=A0A6M3LWT6_9ZZZZ
MLWVVWEYVVGEGVAMSKWWSRAMLAGDRGESGARERGGKVHLLLWRFDHEATALWTVLAYLVWEQGQRDVIPSARSGSLEDLAKARAEGDGEVLFPLVSVDGVQHSLERAGRKLSRRAVRRVLLRLERAGLLERHSGGVRF